MEIAQDIDALSDKFISYLRAEFGNSDLRLAAPIILDPFVKYMIQ